MSNGAGRVNRELVCWLMPDDGMTDESRQGRQWNDVIGRGMEIMAEIVGIQRRWFLLHLIGKNLNRYNYVYI